MAKSEIVETEDDLDLFDAAEGDESTQVQQIILQRNIAVMYVGGMTFVQIAAELGKTPDTISKHFKSTECQQLIAKIQNSDLNYVRNKLRGGMEDFCDRILEDIESEEVPTNAKYKALNLYAKIFGFTETKKAQDNALGSWEAALTDLFQPEPKQLPQATVTVEDEEDDIEED